MAFKFNTQMMKGIGLGVLLLSLPYSFDMSSAATGYTKANMNFRASPNGRDIGGVRKGEKFDILKDTGSWVKIKRSNGRVGWIWKKYVAINKKKRTRVSSKIKTLNSSDQTYGKLVGVRNQLNIRKTPSSRSRRVGALEPNESFTIIGQAKNGWYKVKSANGEIGYASDNYIRKTSTTVASIPIPTPRPQRDSELSDSRFSGVNSDELIPRRRVSQADEEDESSLITAYAPTSGKTNDDPFQSILKPEDGSVLLASTSNESTQASIEAECNDCLAQAEADQNGPNRDLVIIPEKVLAFHKEELAKKKSQLVPIIASGCRISSHFNPNRKHPILGTRRPHNGIDLATWGRALPMRSPMAGKVIKSHYSRGYGHRVFIKLDNGLILSYNHMRKKSPLKVGSRVSPGTVVGQVGSTGLSTGPHLHLEVTDKSGRRVNPLKHFKRGDLCGSLK